MASLAENSIASIPLAHIDKVKDHLLTLSSRPEVVSTAPELRDDAMKPVADRDVGPSSQPQRQPRLATSKSAPPVAMAEWLEPTAGPAAPQPVQQVAATESPHPSNKMEQRASSGNNVYIGGDTQQMPSQVYRDFTESIVRTSMSMMTPRHARLDATSSIWMEQDGVGGETYDTLATEKTPNTCLPGDATYVDLDPYVQLAQAPDMTQQSEGDDNMDDLLAQSTQTNRHHDLLRDMPETPAAMAGRKHGRNGEILNSGPATSTPAGATTTGAKTPGFSQFFPRGDQGDVLSATQLFEQTQAPSSPVPDGAQLLSDPIMTRPSPNIAQRFSISSPELPRSSPLLANVPTVSTSTSEPKGTYTSMLESQEHHRLVRQREEQLRRANRSQRGTINFEDEDDDDDVDVDDEELLAERRRVEGQRSKRAVSATALEDPRRSRGGSRQIDFINLVTSPFVAGDSTKKTQANNDVSELLDEDQADGEEDNDMMLVEDGKEVEIGAEDDDQYDELGQAVLRSQSQNGGGGASENGDIEMEEDGDGGGDVVGGFDGQVEDEETDDEGEDGAAEAHATRDRGDIEDFSQTRPEQLAIADSQPERQAVARTTEVQQHKVIGQSSPPSFIPGSQYTGRTSQDQAMHSRGRNILNSSQRQSIPPPENDRVPSSPPLPATAEDELPAQMPPLDQNSTADSGQRSSRIVVEVPDSDVAAPGPIDDVSTRPNASKTQERGTESNSVPLFSTAQTHVSSASEHSRPQSAPPHSYIASPFKRLASQQSKNSIQSPVRKAGVRNFDEILADAAQPTSNNGESQFDVEAFINNIPHIIDEDQQNSEAQSESPGSRRPKRRMMMKASEQTSPPPRPSALRLKSTAAATAEDAGSNIQESTSLGFADQDGGDVPSNPPTTTKALRNSPSKANEMAPMSTPTEKQTADSINTPDSVKVRERAGAAAVSQMLAKRPRGSARVEKNSRANVAARKGKGKKSAKVAKTKGRSSRVVTAEDHKEASINDAAPEPPVAEHDNGDDTTMAHGAEEADEAVRSSIENQGDEALAPDQHMNDATTADQDNNDQTSATHTEALQNKPVHPRVFALFKGPGENKYYPATLLGWQSDTQQYRVQFDDGIIDLVGPHLVRRLELRVDDAVKIDMPNMRSATWLVKGFGEPSEKSSLTDMYGHSHIKVQARASRASLPKTDKGPIAQAEEQQITVEVQYVYLSPTMWVHFKDRSLDPLSSTTNGSTSRPATPSGAMQMPNATTPGSRTRRSLLPTAKLLEKPGRDGSVASSVAPVEKAIFANMAFAISYGGNEAEKASVARAISRNGGVILENGFDELFDLPNFDDEPTNSASKGRAEDADAANARELSDTLRLKPEYTSLGFVALIADRHSRREKFIQALALNLPTLSGKWITDSLSTDRNPSLSSTTSDNNTNEPTTLPWSKYLLPAGESSYLDGAIRSRSLVPYPPSTAFLANTIRDRPRLVPGGTAALIVVSRKAKAALSRRRTFAFLSLALGAVAARSVGNLEEARKLLGASASSGGNGEERGVKWQWVYVDSDQAEARKALFARTSSIYVSKRGSKGKNAAMGKRVSGAGAVDGDDGAKDSAASRSSVRVVDNEFVVQSLILGDLLD